ncbi:UV radiation resistance-associated gene protein [Sitodiplosis mosellana]|uniref:UV radiation resistance-associated gene protein n=1 Tax=Sitodiplosis mosellana TaxID=263140 RepID=UPI0024452E6D|nr:UV radiation resistance-associated gene protein [Sitodiplosis mosellana]
MINRPRCRDWSPIATQQLRLRNLIQITGHNIDAEPNTSIYFTLHLTLMSSPFFTSEPLESFRNAIWAEINCQSIHKSTSQFVVVRVWQTNRARNAEHSDTKHLRRLSSSGTVILQDSHHGWNHFEPIDEHHSNDISNGKDKVLFVWGVYFSGLVPITKRSEVKLMDNALIFYIHGGFFTSVDYLLAESVPKQYNHFYETTSRNQRQLQQPPKSTQFTHKGLLTKNTTNNVIATKGTTVHTINTAKNCDSLNASRNYLNELDVGGGVDRKAMANSPKRHDNEYVSGRLSPSCDAIANLPHHKQNHSNQDAQDQSADEEYTFSDPTILKVRFLDKEFFKWEIRRSYNVQKLLMLQEKQRIYRRMTQSANEVMEKICMKSASCLNLQLIANKGMLYRPRGNPSIGRTLNRLLTAQKEQPKPEDLLRAQELRRKIETAKFRCRFLNMERDRYKVILRKLHDKCTKLNDENIEKESWLMDDYRQLSRDSTFEQKSLHSSRQKIFEKVKESLIQRQHQLLGQLRDIYVIKEHDRSGIYEINGICLPNTDALRMYYSSNPPGTNNAALSLSVAICYVAHVALLCSSVLNVPLRNKIIYQGSASKIRDDIKMLSEHDREFPLYCRNIPPSDSLLYAAFLLNQNISQIKFMLNIHVSREDLRATLPNLLAILSVGDQTTERFYAIQESASASFLAIDAHDAPMSSISETSIDMMLSVPANVKVYSTSEENINLPRQNIGSCRTRGTSFSDDHLVKRHDEKVDRTAASNATSPRKTFSSEPILPTGHIS